MIKKIISKFEIIPVAIGYLLINIYINFNLFWNQLFFDKSKIGAVWGEVVAYEWFTEKFYENLISGKNPFGTINNMLYPFGFNLGLVDAGNGLFFPLFKFFLSTHQTLSMIIVLSLLLANIGMYLLLRKLNISRIVSFIIGAAFGYMTFLMPRQGHLNYWSHFLFPWFYYFILVFLSNKRNKIKIFAIIGSSIIFVLTLWINFYYSMMLLISIFSLLSYFFLFERKLFINQLKKYWTFLLFKISFILFLLIPWLTALYDMFKFDQVPKTEGWGGAIEFGSDLFNYLLPSGYSFLFTKFPILLAPFLTFLKLYTPSSRIIFENFTYPGIIILVSFFILFIFYKSINKDVLKKLMPFLFTSFVFFILTLGPFLHVFGHWTLTVDEGIKIVVPLPYIILHYIPFLNNIRVPARLIVAFIFFAYIVSGYVINYLLTVKIKNKRVRNLIFLVIFITFFVDQQYYVDPLAPPKTVFPYGIYNSIKLDPEKSTVLEIPFTVRDGFTYFGNGDAFLMIVGESIHKKSVLGGYTGRIAYYKRAYYQNNPFLGFLGRMIDANLMNNPGVDKKDIEQWKIIDFDKSREAINFLDLKYIVTNDSMNYASTLSAILRELGYDKTKQEQNFSLWKRPIDNIEFLNINLSNPSSSIFLGLGWYDPETNFRWSDKKASVMFKVNKKRKMTLNFSGASFHKNQPVTIYLNKKKIGSINMNTEINNYRFPINLELDKGINTIYFIFNQAYRPSEVMINNLDKRQIGGQFTKIYLQELHD